MNRTFTLLTVRANHPDAIDTMSFERRRSDGAGWVAFEVAWELRVYPRDRPVITLDDLLVPDG